MTFQDILLRLFLALDSESRILKIVNRYELTGLNGQNHFSSILLYHFHPCSDKNPPTPSFIHTTPVVKGDPMAPPFPDSHFDAVLLSSTIFADLAPPGRPQSALNVAKTLGAAHAILKPQGLLVFSVLNKSAFFTNTRRPSISLETAYSLFTYKRALKKIGFSISQIYCSPKKLIDPYLVFPFDSALYNYYKEFIDSPEKRMHKKILLTFLQSAGLLKYLCYSHIILCTKNAK